ncbi:hypothetical protein JIG36_09300 [Actinoplanes sp. LDG1-06]|uniref:Secreted protein n=1 Tax=Paractinoplanes ovalisporus TaxID=2810368 RepID=A0ABS2A7C8_9ACTN|nr:hypothetical protein [Actinoplanes ovalisporus]MBM2615749.1 hypothetical protein [Actinoplanes ovalisporus]
MNPTIRTRLAALGAAATVATGGVLAVQSPASAAATYGPVTVNCGIVTCSAYLSRSATKLANQKLTIGGGGYAAAAAVMCFPLTLPPLTPVGVACGAVATVQGAWIAQEIQEAATLHGARGACLKMTFTRPVRGMSTITYWSTNNGTYCKD